MVGVLAIVFILADDHDKALDQLEYLLSIPSWISREGLALTPKYMTPQERRLRALPRFKKLLTADQLVL